MVNHTRCHCVTWGQLPNLSEPHLLSGGGNGAFLHRLLCPLFVETLGLRLATCRASKIPLQWGLSH